MALCRLSIHRTDLHFLPAHKSQTQSSRPWREPSNHQQPQKKGRGYLTPVAISSHTASTHTWLMRPGATGYNSEVFYQRAYIVCTCAFNMCHNRTLNGSLMSDLFSGSLAALTGGCPHSEENKQAPEENGPNSTWGFHCCSNVLFCQDVKY